LSAVYSGDTNFAPSTGTLAYTVSGSAIQTITFQPLPTAYVGLSATLSATTNAGTTITYKVVSGPATLNGTTLTYTGVGSVVVEADAPGNATYAPGFSQETIAVTLLTEPVGTSSGTLSTVVTFSTAGTLGSVGVFTQGATGLDFTQVIPGGTCVLNTVYAVGQSCTVEFTFKPTRPGQRYGGIVFSTSAGLMIANSYIYGVGNGPQVGWLPGTQTTMGSGLNEPSGVAVDGSGNVYVSEYGGGLAEIAAGGAQRTLGSFGITSDVAVDGSGNVFVTDDTSVYEVMAVNGVIPPTPEIVVLATGFSQLNGIAVSGTGNVYLGNGTGSAADGAVYELASVNGVIPASPAKTMVGSGFGWVTGVAVDQNGDVFASDEQNKAVYEIVAVNGAVGASSVTRALGGSFTSPSNVGLDAANDVYVTDMATGLVSEFMAVNEVVPSNPVIRTVGTGIVEPQGMVVDSNGNIFIADEALAQVVKLDYADAPSLTFATTAVGSVSSDSPQTVTMANDGNMPLTFAPAFTPPVTGPNPSITAGFVIDSSSTCPQQNVVPVTTPTAPQLNTGASCTYAISFAPVTGGVDSGKMVVTDNAVGLSQTVLLNGTAMEGTTSVMTAAPPTTYAGQTVTLTATVKPVTGTTPVPTGTVTFYNGTTSLGTEPLVNGVAILGTDALPVGADSLTCVYSGDTLYQTSSCAPVTETVQILPTALTVTQNPNPAYALTPVTFTMHLTVNGQPAGAGYTVGWTLTGEFVAGQQTTGTAVTDATGTATFTFSPGFFASSHFIDASFAQTATMTGATVSAPVNIIKNNTSMTLLASPSPGYQNQPVNLVATLTNTSSAATPTEGSVVFTDVTNGVVPLGTVSLVAANGTNVASATLVTSGLTPGSHTIQAVYGGSLDFNAAAAVTVQVTILPQDFTLSANPPSITIETEHHGSMQLGLTSIGGFAAPITLSCAGTIPEWVTCEFSPQQVALPAGGTNVPATLTIDTDALLNYKSDARGTGLGGRVVLAGLLPLMLIGFRRRRGLRGLVLMAVASVLVMAMTACSGHYPAHTTPGTYTVTVQASGQTAGASAPTVHTLDVTLVVTP